MSDLIDNEVFFCCVMKVGGIFGHESPTMSACVYWCLYLNYACGRSIRRQSLCFRLCLLPDASTLH